LRHRWAIVLPGHLRPVVGCRCSGSPAILPVGSSAAGDGRIRRAGDRRSRGPAVHERRARRAARGGCDDLSDAPGRAALGAVGGCAGRVLGQASRQVVRRGQRLPRLGAAPWPEGPRDTPTELQVRAGWRGPATRRMLGVPWQCQPRPRQPHGSRVRQCG
jgi:hypothetical protein